MYKPDYLISTPENVDLHLELAGMGNRVIAALADSISIGAIYAVLTIALAIFVVVVENSGSTTTLKTSLYFWSVCIYILALFCTTFGYFLFFELSWQGQTPGKRMVGIRTIDCNGQPASWTAICIRNLMRLFDTLPGIYPGIVPMLFDKNERRFGDMCAGTIVIRERNHSLGNENLKLKQYAHADAAIDTGQISADEYNLIVAFMKRRNMMMADERQNLAENLSTYLRSKLGIENQTDSPESLVENVFLAYRQRAELEAG